MASIISRSLIFASIFAASGVLAGSPVTCSNPQLSCKNTTVVSDLCCFNAPGGQLLLTQFWDSSPSTGPSDYWTLHGLWPDHCDGTFDANCDASRAHSDIRNILTSFGKSSLLADMDLFWKDVSGNDESFWSHEWDKHGTCISTLTPSCYNGYTANQEVPDFFQKAVDLFKGLDTYTTLANAGIVPSTSATYTSAQIQAAIHAVYGFDVTIGCSSGALNQVWYSFDVLGSVVTGDFIPTSPDGSKSTCPSSGIKYNPKSGSPGPPRGPPTTTTTPPPPPPKTTTTKTTSTKKTSTTTKTTPPPPPPTTSTTTDTTTSTMDTTTTDSSTFTTITTTSSPAPTGTPGTLSGTGYLNANTDGSQVGCLISRGTWYVGGTCATYTATPSDTGFTLSSSKGACGVSNSIFSCGSSITASTFTAIDGNLAVDGNTQFYADSIPSGSSQVTVSTSSGSVAVTFSWQSLSAFEE